MEMCPQCGLITEDLPFIDDTGDPVCSWECVLIERRATELLRKRRANPRLPSGQREYPVREHSDVGNE